jgi:hypothetical protein
MTFMTAVPVARAEVRSFRLSRPAAQAASALEVTAFAALTLAALAVWLLILPLELLAFVAG